MGSGFGVSSRSWQAQYSVTVGSLSLRVKSNEAKQSFQVSTLQWQFSVTVGSRSWQSQFSVAVRSPSWQSQLAVPVFSLSWQSQFTLYNIHYTIYNIQYTSSLGSSSFGGGGGFLRLIPKHIHFCQGHFR